MINKPQFVVPKHPKQTICHSIASRLPMFLITVLTRLEDQFSVCLPRYKALSGITTMNTCPGCQYTKASLGTRGPLHSKFQAPNADPSHTLGTSIPHELWCIIPPSDTA